MQTTYEPPKPPPQEPEPTAFERVLFEVLRRVEPETAVWLDALNHAAKAGRFFPEQAEGFEIFIREHLAGD